MLLLVYMLSHTRCFTSSISDMGEMFIEACLGRCLGYKFSSAFLRICCYFVPFYEDKQSFSYYLYELSGRSYQRNIYNNMLFHHCKIRRIYIKQESRNMACLGGVNCWKNGWKHRMMVTKAAIKCF